MLSRARQIISAHLGISSKPTICLFSTKNTASMVRLPRLVICHHSQLTMSSQAEDKITNWVTPNDKTGEFKRGQSQFRNFIKKGGEFPPEKGRYHLYVCLQFQLSFFDNF
jgi:hypothetical protein